MTSVRPEEMGPVDYLIVEFPGDRLTGEAFPMLIDLVNQGIIRIIDLAFLRKDADGSVLSLSIVDLEAMNMLEFALFEGASTGLLTEEELAEAASALEPGSAAGVLIYENLWAAPFTAALRRAGGVPVAGGRIPIHELIEALDATEPVT